MTRMRMQNWQGGPAITPQAVLESVKPHSTALLDAWRMGGTKGMKPIGEEEIAKAASILTKYKDGKANLESRIIEDELWWELRHWEAIGRKGGAKKAARGPEPTSGWLFNSIMNKHADAMDNFPEPVVLPRELDDEESAKVLSSVLPVILEYNNFEQTYNDNWWEKLKHGTAVYGQFWNPEKENGLGDIDIRDIDLLKIFWEPGITDIQKSRNLFIVELVDEDLLNAQYPQYAGKMGGNTIDVAQYCYDDTVDNSGKSVVVDWYYRVVNAAGKTVLHYVRFVGNVVLYASQNDPEFAERGWYDHGEYPVVFDVLFPEKGTPVGFGYVSICKDPQLYIDKLSAHIMENAMMTTKKRFFVSESAAINEEEFLDWSKPLVHVASGDLDDRRIREIVCQPLSSIYLEVMQMKIEEMKDTSSNRDVNSGGTGSGVTAAAAIAALQEAGNKTSRDMIAGSYRAYNNIDRQTIELARQFYDETRAFRITGEMGNYQFVEFNNADIRDQQVGVDSMGQPLFRKPIFDIKIKAQKKNPFSRMEQNERAKELFAMGFFNPEMAQQAMSALDMMEFEGIDKVREKVMEGQTLLNIVQQMNQQMTQMAMIIQSITGQDMGVGVQPGGGQQKAPAPKDGGRTPVTDSAMQAQAPMTGYGQRLAARSKPDMNLGAMP